MTIAPDFEVPSKTNVFAFIVRDPELFSVRESGVVTWTTEKLVVADGFPAGSVASTVRRFVASALSAIVRLNDPDASAVVPTAPVPPFASTTLASGSVVPETVRFAEAVMAGVGDSAMVGAILSCVTVMLPVATCPARSVEMKEMAFTELSTSGKEILNVPDGADPVRVLVPLVTL